MKSTTWLDAVRALKEMGTEQTGALEELLRAGELAAIEEAAERLAKVSRLITSMAETMALRCDGHPRKVAEDWVEEKYLELVTGMTSEDIDLYGDGPLGPKIRRNTGEFTID